MRYVVTFDHWTGECDSFTVYAASVDVAVELAKEKANKKYNHFNCDFYTDSSVVSVVRV